MAMSGVEHQVHNGNVHADVSVIALIRVTVSDKPDDSPHAIRLLAENVDAVFMRHPGHIASLWAARSF
jgi:hypothetical protein